jgi:hypothetical protein
MAEDCSFRPREIHRTLPEIHTGPDPLERLAVVPGHRSHERALGAQATHNSVAPRSVPQRPTCDALQLRSRDPLIHRRTVPMLYRWGYLVSFSAISASLESASCTFHKASVNRGSNPCRGANFSFAKFLWVLQLTPPAVPAASVSQKFRGICVGGGFSGSKWCKPGCALNHAGSGRWPLSTTQTLQFLR